MAIEIKEYIRLMRPYQWLKNVLLFAPLFFSGQLDEKSIYIVVWAVVCFCMTSSIGYIINDWVDRDRDRYHHEKKKRPFSAGTVGGFEALLISGGLLAGVIVTVWLFELSHGFISILFLYFCLTSTYSLGVKHVVILELFAVSMGFVLRVFAGGAVAGITISSWLFLTVFFISMLISVAKRLSEYQILGEEHAIRHRESQTGYSRIYLQNMLWVCGGITLVVYALYVVDHGGVTIFSVLPASYGVFRFIYLTDQGRGSDPIKALFSDFQLMLASFIFFVYLAIMIYIIQ